jgi:hypothetical protein
MSNAYDNASLLVTPNGYEAGTIFSAKPTDGSGDLSFSRASTALRRNSAGLWEEVANDVPRLQYPVGGGCPSWLFEPQATNLIPSSNGFVGNVTTGITDSPISGVTSVRCTKTISSVEYFQTLYSATITNSTPYASSLYFKYDGHNIDSSLEFNNAGDFGQSWRANIEIRSTGITISSVSSCTAVLVAEANGWYRLEVSITSATVTTNSGSILAKAEGANGASFLVTTSNLTEGSVATSPIITAGSAVTRVGDSANKTGISALIGQTEGTMYWEGNLPQDQAATAKYLLQLYGDIPAISITTYSTVINILSTPIDASVTFTAGAYAKIAICYNDSGNFRIFVNGVKTHDLNTFVGAARTSLAYGVRDGAGDSQPNCLNKEAIIYKTALSDSEAIALTTL